MGSAGTAIRVPNREDARSAAADAGRDNSNVFVKNIQGRTGRTASVHVVLILMVHRKQLPSMTHTFHARMIA